MAVKGLGIFRDYFADYKDSFLLIGGGENQCSIQHFPLRWWLVHYLAVDRPRAIRPEVEPAENHFGHYGPRGEPLQLPGP